MVVWRCKSDVLTCCIYSSCAAWWCDGMLVSLGDACHKAGHVRVWDGEPVPALVLLPGRDAPSVLHLHLCHVSGSRELWLIPISETIQSVWTRDFSDACKYYQYSKRRLGVWELMKISHPLLPPLSSFPSPPLPTSPVFTVSLLPPPPPPPSVPTSGHNAATLHYGHAGEPNTRIVRDGDMW